MSNSVTKHQSAIIIVNMATNEINIKSKKNDDERNQFIWPIKYSSQLPDPAVGCKFLPCGKTLLDFTVEPVSFPQLETQFENPIQGLHLLLDIDLVNPNAYEHNETGKAEMDPRDAALLSDIEALHIKNPKPKTVHNFPTRAQECRELFAKERSSVPRPRSGLQRLPPTEAQPLEPESLSLEQQKQIVHQTFVDIEKPLRRHPTKTNSNARPVAMMAIFPDANLSHNEFVQVQFGIAPTDNSKSLLKDCGNYLVNFKLKTEPILKQAQANGLYTYLSDQRYKEERTAENAERGERFVLREKGGSLYYQQVNRHIKLRKQRPNLQANTALSLLVKRTKDKEQQLNSVFKKQV